MLLRNPMAQHRKPSRLREMKAALSGTEQHDRAKVGAAIEHHIANATAPAPSLVAHHEPGQRRPHFEAGRMELGGPADQDSGGSGMHQGHYDARRDFAEMNSQPKGSHAKGLATKPTVAEPLEPLPTGYVGKHRKPE